MPDDDAQTLTDTPEAPEAPNTPDTSDTSAPESADPPKPTAEGSEASDPAASAPAPATDLDAPPEDEPMVTPGMNWFVLRVASNKENSVRKTLLRKIKIEGYDGSDPDKPHLVNRILVPTEKTKQIKAGKQKIIETKLYPGYVFVEMKLESDGRIPQDVFFLIKETTGVGDFIGTAGRPSPMSEPEIEKMINAAKPPEEQPQVKMEFQPGDHVKITAGPFENMEASVDQTLPDQGKVRVIVTIFGRATPVELEYWLIEKAEE
jgi:transcriptional antiterminator NusG